LSVEEHRSSRRWCALPLSINGIPGRAAGLAWASSPAFATLLLNPEEFRTLQLGKAGIQLTRKASLPPVVLSLMGARSSRNTLFASIDISLRSDDSNASDLGIP
jgi:hypothetical protein